MRRKTEEDYHDLAKEVRVKWLGPYPRTIRVETVWECMEGHRFEATYRNVKRSPGCPICGKDPRKVFPAEYNALAKQKDFEWIGPEVPNTKTKTWWRCLEGHEWQAIYNSLWVGIGCPVCAGNMRKTPSDYHMLAKERELKWLGPKVHNNRTKTRWECIQEHQWEATHNDIQQGSGCPHCARVAPKTIEDYFALAEKRGFEWLGPFPVNVSIKTKWECSEGHEWEAPYSSIGGGSGCPYCASNTPKTKEDYYTLAEAIGYEWLGPFPSGVAQKTNWKCHEGHIWHVSYNSIQQGNRCRYCAGQIPKGVNDYHGLVKKRGLEWVGDLPKTTDLKTLWRCPVGHEWRASYGKIRDGRGCPVCSNRVPKTEEDYYRVAEERGVKWLGSRPPVVIEKTGWECPEGHRWEASYNNISRGTGCPKCINLVNSQRVSNIQKRLWKMIGGRLNYPLGSYHIDIALPGKKIAIEYDSWFWHGSRLEKDKQRDKELIGAGWRVLHVRSNNKLPTSSQLDDAFLELQSGKTKSEIILDDWGQGPTFTDLRH